MRPLPPNLQNHRFLGTHRFEMTPFHFKGELYLLENFCDYNPADFAPDEYPPRTLRDGFRIRRFRDDAIIGEPVTGSYFASAFVHDGKVYVFASQLNEPVLHTVLRYVSDDLIHWSKPEIAFEADPGCLIFNTAFVQNGEKFIGVYETDTPERRQKYIFKFWESDDLKNFKVIPGAAYGLDKYVGGCSLYMVKDLYYLFYLEECPDGTYEMRICRSKNLRDWTEGNRPIITPDLTHEINPDCPGRMELNASDTEIIEHDGKTMIFWLGGDQHGTCDMQMAEFPGSQQAFLESFFC